METTAPTPTVQPTEQNRIVARGRVAELHWGYHLAASLGEWEFTADKTGGGALKAQIATADAFRVLQRPLTFRVNRQNARPWNWPVLELQVADRTLTARLGPQE